MERLSSGTCFEVSRCTLPSGRMPSGWGRDPETCKAAYQAPNAVFVTNSMECAQRLPGRGLRAYVLGGVIKPGTLAIIGCEAVERLKKYNFTNTFLGANGIAVGPGFTTPDPEEAMVKSTAAARARETWVLADSNKFGTITAASVLPLGEAGIITDRLEDRRYLEHTDIKVV